MATFPILKNFIDNEFRDPRALKWFPHLSPWTSEHDCDVPDSDLMDLVQALKAANSAFTKWQLTTNLERSAFLLKIAAEIKGQAAELARIQSEDEGSTVEWALQKSIPRAAEIFETYAHACLKTEVSAERVDSSYSMSSARPLGVVAIITPYCDPLVSIALKVAPALAAGNTVIVKPSEHAPRSADALARLIPNTGLPPGVLNLLQGRGEVIGEAIAMHPGVATIAFTGSTDVGRVFHRTSAELLKRTQLSLGARNPVLVFAGINLKKTIGAIVRATLQFHGPTCLRGSRIFVQDPIYKEFLEAYTEEAAKFRDQIGVLASRLHVERFHAAVTQAKRENGKILFGGSDSTSASNSTALTGNKVEPTAVFDLTNCSTLQQEEVLGPFVTIASFKYQHDAVKFANTNPFARAAYIFEPQMGKALRVATKLDASRVFINSDQPVIADHVDADGLKSSGLGSEGVWSSLRFFSKTSVLSQSYAGDV